MPVCKLVLRSGRVCARSYDCKDCHYNLYHDPDFVWPTRANRYLASDFNAIPWNKPEPEEAFMDVVVGSEEDEREMNEL